MPAAGTGLGAELTLAAVALPRVLSALAAGMMLAVAGADPEIDRQLMASPEVLGISSGAAWRRMMLFMVPGDAFVWLAARRQPGGRNAADHHDRRRPRRFSTERMLLAGIALSTAFTTVIFLLLQQIRRMGAC